MRPIPCAKIRMIGSSKNIGRKSAPVAGSSSLKLYCIIAAISSGNLPELRP